MTKKLADTIDKLSNKTTLQEVPDISNVMRSLQQYSTVLQRLEELVARNKELPNHLDYALDVLIENYERTVQPQVKSKKPILCLDFDGVIHSYSSGWTGASNIPDDPVPGAIDFIIRSMKHFKICVFSSRSSQIGGIDAMYNWLYYWIDKHTGNVLQTQKIIKQITFPVTKPSAFITIDDRAHRFDGTWPTIQQMKAFKPWHKHYSTVS